MSERSRIDRLLDQAREGRSSGLLIRGDPGVGKTTLLDYAVARAEDIIVLSTRAIEVEADIPFAGLADVLRPLVTSISSLPSAQASALSAALGLEEPGAGDRFTIYAGTLSLLALAAEDSPVLVAIDDSHSLDTASQRALLFAARRLYSERVALLATVRAGETTELEGVGMDELTLGALDELNAIELVMRYAGVDVAPEVARRLVELTDGNPLALIETPRLLGAAQLAGTEPLGEPLATGDRLQAAFASRLQHLAPAAQQALLVVAASDSNNRGLITRALEAAGIHASALDELQAAGILEVHPERVMPRHPLIRSAAYHASTAEERRGAHAALAEACEAHHFVERRAWHLASASLTADEDVAAALEEAGKHARARFAHGAAAEAFNRAAAMSPNSERRVARLVEAATEWHNNGNVKRALEALDDALEIGPTDPILRADIARVGGRIQTWGGAVVEARDLLLAESARVEGSDVRRAALLAVDAVVPACMDGHMDSAVPAAQRAYELASRVGEPLASLAALMLAIPLAAKGDAVSAKASIERARGLLDKADPAALGPVISAMAETLMWLDEADQAVRVIDRIIGAGRQQGLPALLPYALGVAALLELRGDRFSAAYADAAEGVVLARDTGQENQLGYNLASLARIEAARGLEEDARRHVRESVEVERRFGASSLRLYHQAALGHLELSLGLHAAAITALERVARFVDRSGIANPEMSRWAPDLIESYARAGRRADAEHALVDFGVAIDACPTSWGHAAFGRCRAFLAAESYEAEFQGAFEAHEHGASAFERARTQLCYGELLRRDGRRNDARRELNEALEMFESLPAPLWAEKARVELRACGGTVVRRERDLSPRLTPQELQVALIVARGATNKEAAAQLFLSPKTVEHHLSSIYAKLQLRSRTELAHAVAQGAPSLRDASVAQFDSAQG